MELKERLLRIIESGRFTPGGGTVGPNGGEYWGGKPIMALVNPDGPAAVARIAELEAMILQLGANAAAMAKQLSGETAMTAPEPAWECPRCGCVGCEGGTVCPGRPTPEPASDALVDMIVKRGLSVATLGTPGEIGYQIAHNTAIAAIEALTRQSGEVSEAMVGQRLLVWLGGSRDSLSPETVAALQEIARAMQEARDE